jgi:transcriptional regulator with XRE-family HTH domain
MPRKKSQARPWTKQEIDLLGTQDDHKIAKKLGRSYHSVNTKRRTLGIPRFLEQVFQANKYILFDYNYKDLAKRLGVSPSTVIDWRNRIRLPLKNRWTSDRITLLGTMPDVLFSKRFQIPTSAVRKKRRDLGIPTFVERYSCWTDEMVALLGTMTDTALAKKLNRAVSTVRTKRTKMGIPAYKGSGHKWTTREIYLLGKLSDTKLAKHMGVSKTEVTDTRRRLGISPNTGHSTCDPKTTGVFTAPKNHQESIHISPTIRKVLTTLSRNPDGITLLGLGEDCRLPNDKLIDIINELILSDAVALIQGQPQRLKLTKPLNLIFDQYSF